MIPVVPFRPDPKRTLVFAAALTLLFITACVMIQTWG